MKKGIRSGGKRVVEGRKRKRKEAEWRNGEGQSAKEGKEGGKERREEGGIG